MQDLAAHAAWLSRFPRAKPAETIAIIRQAALQLALLGDIGRPGPKPGSRLLSVPNRPYVIAYSLEGSSILIEAVFHTAQNR